MPRCPWWKGPTPAAPRQVRLACDRIAPPPARLGKNPGLNVPTRSDGWYRQRPAVSQQIAPQRVRLNDGAGLQRKPPTVEEIAALEQLRLPTVRLAVEQQRGVHPTTGLD